MQATKSSINRLYRNITGNKASTTVETRAQPAQAAKSTPDGDKFVELQDVKGNKSDAAAPHRLAGALKQGAPRTKGASAASASTEAKSQPVVFNSFDEF